MEICNLISVVIILYLTVDPIQTASIACDENNKANKTEKFEYKGMKNFLHSIQCALEKAKPKIDELEQEAKRLEEEAKRIGFGILKTFGAFMDKLVGDIHPTGSKNENSNERVSQETTTTVRPITSTTTMHAFDIDNDIFAADDGLHLCIDSDSVKDHNNLCERIHQ